MTIELADKSGSLGQASTNKGFGDAREEVLSSKGNRELKDFFINGKTKDTSAASKQALVIAHDTKNSQVRNTLVNISKLLEKAEDFVVVQTA